MGLIRDNWNFHLPGNSVWLETPGISTCLACRSHSGQLEFSSAWPVGLFGDNFNFDLPGLSVWLGTWSPRKLIKQVANPTPPSLAEVETWRERNISREGNTKPCELVLNLVKTPWKCIRKWETLILPREYCLVATTGFRQNDHKNVSRKSKPWCCHLSTVWWQKRFFARMTA